jgi:hypothetical protein
MSPFGTFRTSRDVRLEPAMRPKAEVRQRLRIYEFTPLAFFRRLEAEPGS